MKRLAVGIALAFLLPNCIKTSPMAEEQQSAEEKLRASIGPFCDTTCQNGMECGGDVIDDCAGQCRDYMSVFVDHGAECVTLGQEAEDCIKSLPVCDQLGTDNKCDDGGAAWDKCRRNGPPPAGPAPVYCDNGGGTSGGVAPTTDKGSSLTTTCDVYYEGCSDGSEYRISCDLQNTLFICNCFKDGNVTGVGFVPEDGMCPSDLSFNGPCGWNIQQ